jgi:hypothetical protein
MVFELLLFSSFNRNRSFAFIEKYATSELEIKAEENNNKITDKKPMKSSIELPASRKTGEKELIKSKYRPGSGSKTKNFVQ